MEGKKSKVEFNDKELKIMIIDDNPDDRILAIRELEKQFDNLSITEIINNSDFKDALDKRNIDLVITDYRLRWTTGLDVLKKIKSHYPDIPVIMFTGTGTEEVAVEAMKCGLDDYVVKSPKHFMRLPVSVKKALDRKKEKKEAEEAIKKSELKYKAIFQNTGTKSFIFGKNGIIEIVNNQFEKMSGYNRDEISKIISWKEFIIQDDYKRFQKHIDSAIDNPEGPPEYFKLDFVNRYNDKRSVLASLNTIPETDKLICSMLDITKYKEIMDALNASEEMFRVAFENSPIGIMLLSLDGKILEVNKSSCELLGISEEKLIDCDCEDIIESQNFKKFKDRLYDLKEKDKKKIDQEIEISIDNNGTKTFKTISSIIENPKGEQLYYIVQFYNLNSDDY